MTQMSMDGLPRLTTHLTLLTTHGIYGLYACSAFKFMAELVSQHSTIHLLQVKFLATTQALWQPGPSSNVGAVGGH